MSQRSLDRSLLIKMQPLITNRMMRKVSLLCLFFYLIVSVPSNCFGQTTPRAINSFGLIVEQDAILDFVGLPGNEDRNYTMGLGISITSGKLSEGFDTHLQSTDFLAKFIKLKDPSLYVYTLPMEISIKIIGFTPDELRATDPVIGDRPYSSVFFVNSQFTKVDQGNYRSRSWGLGLGLMGIPNVASNLQTAIHKAMNENNTRPPYNPEGWNNQISQGGEPTLLITYQTRKLHTTKALEREAQNGGSATRKLQAQLSTTFNLNALYVTQANVGADFRVGLLDLRNWYENIGWGLDPVPTTFTEAQKASYFDRNREFECYFFTSLRTGVQLYNASLHGQFRESEYTIPYSDTGFVLGTGHAGIAVGWDRAAFSFYWAFKTPEYWNDMSRVHYWAGVNANVFF